MRERRNVDLFSQQLNEPQGLWSAAHIFRACRAIRELGSEAHTVVRGNSIVARNIGDTSCTTAGSIPWASELAALQRVVPRAEHHITEPPCPRLEATVAAATLPHASTPQVARIGPTTRGATVPAQAGLPVPPRMAGFDRDRPCSERRLSQLQLGGRGSSRHPLEPVVAKEAEQHSYQASTSPGRPMAPAHGAAAVSTCRRAMVSTPLLLAPLAMTAAQQAADCRQHKYVDRQRRFCRSTLAHRHHHAASARGRSERR